jgi:K+-transporting ATPase ATPase C chain
MGTAMKNLIKEVRISLIATLLLGIMVCGLYPLVVWVAGHGLFPEKSEGSLIMSKGKVIGSSLLAQGFSGPDYFHPRPSAAGEGYDGARSGATNWGPLSKKLIDTVRKRVVAYRVENHLAPDTLVPADAVTASASGLDPQISVKNALLQAKRVAKARSLAVKLVMEKIDAHTEGRTLGILGEPRVNVLMLNLDLDGKR